MISIKTPREVELMIIAGNIVYKTHQYLKPYIKAGTTTDELNTLAKNYIISLGGIPSFEGYNEFPKAICTSINDVVVHGIPGNYKLKDGDIISIDIGASYKGYHGDSAWTYPVGNVSSDKKNLLKHTEIALYEGIKQIHPGCRIGDISNAIETYAKKHHLSVVEELVGHGVGNSLHEEPNVPNYGKKGSGPILKAGMVIAIEPMLNLGTREVYMEDDSSILTFDCKPSAHFEHTVLVTDNGYKILTGE